MQPEPRELPTELAQLLAEAVIDNDEQGFHCLVQGALATGVLQPGDRSIVPLVVERLEPIEVRRYVRWVDEQGQVLAAVGQHLIAIGLHPGSDWSVGPGADHLLITGSAARTLELRMKPLERIGIGWALEVA